MVKDLDKERELILESLDLLLGRIEFFNSRAEELRIGLKECNSSTKCEDCMVLHSPQNCTNQNKEEKADLTKDCEKMLEEAKKYYGTDNTTYGDVEIMIREKQDKETPKCKFCNDTKYLKTKEPDGTITDGRCPQCYISQNKSTSPKTELNSQNSNSIQETNRPKDEIGCGDDYYDEENQCQMYCGERGELTLCDKCKQQDTCEVCKEHKCNPKICGCRCHLADESASKDEKQ